MFFCYVVRAARKKYFKCVQTFPNVSICLWENYVDRIKGVLKIPDRANAHASLSAFNQKRHFGKTK